MDSYSFLKWGKSQMAKITDAKFARYVFAFVSDTPGVYRLSGMAYDTSGHEMGTAFRPSVRSQQARPLPNLFKGTFELSKATLQSFGIDGTFDCFLNPKKSHEGESSQRNYVSYKIIDRDQSIALRNFSMNPSPPYNSGNTSRP